MGLDSTRFMKSPAGPPDAPETTPAGSPVAPGAAGSETTVDGSTPGPPQEAGERPTPSPSAPMFGRYRLLNELGRGGVGVVYRAEDALLRREVALKVLLTGAHSLPADRQRFLREARAAAGLRHPGIVEVYDIGEQDQHPYFTMRLVRGGTLARRLRDGPFDPEGAAALISAVARALHFAHSRGLVHRDVKPGNILLEDGRTPILSDFGLVKELDADTEALTRATQLLGTPSYIAPEQVQGDAVAATALSDQYALGVVLYEALSGRQAFRGPNAPAILRMVLRQELVPLDLRVVPPALARICGKAMSLRPADRYATAADLADDLDRFLRGEPVQARGPDLSDRVRAMPRRVFDRVGPVGAVLIGALGVLVGTQVLRASVARWRERDLEQVAEVRRVAMQERVEALQAEGRTEEADQTFEAYTSFYKDSNPSALAQAWLWRGERLWDLGRTEDGARATATAYALADNPRDQAEALLALGREFVQRREWSRLKALLRTIEERAPRSLNLDEVKEWRFQVAMSERDLVTAQGLNPWPELDGVLSALSSVALTGRSALSGALWAHGAPDQVALWGRRGPVSVVPDLLGGGGEWTFSLGDPGSNNHSPLILPAALDLSTLVVRNGAPQVPILEADGQTVRPLGLNSGANLAGGLVFDADGDGRAELLTARDRTFHWFVRDELGAWRGMDADADTSSANSEVNGVVRADLDGDGRDEIAVNTTDWGAYDVRVFSNEGRALSLRGRARLGVTEHLVVAKLREGPRLVALQVHDPKVPLNYRVFPKGGPQGEAPGLHVLTWDGARLTTSTLLPLPPSPFELRGRDVEQVHMQDQRALTADLNGDGEDELVLAVRDTWMYVYHRAPDGSWREIGMDGIVPVVAANLDGDPAMELVARTADAASAIVVFGAGDQRLPPRIIEPVEVAAPPPGLDPALREPWRRAEDLVAVGLAEVGARRINELAGLAVGTPAEAQGRMRAAEILSRSGELVEASGAYQLAARDPAVAPQALEAAARSALSAGRYDLAAATLGSRLALPDPPADLVEASARLAAMDAANATADFNQGLPAGWQVLDPLGVSGAPGGGLQIGMSANTTALRLPVTWGGGPLRLRWVTTPTRLDWGSGLYLALSPDGERPVSSAGMSVVTGSGGGIAQSWAGCPGSGLIDFPVDEVIEGDPLVIDWRWWPERKEASCTVSRRGVEELHRAYVLDELGVSPGELWLVFSAMNPAETSVVQTLQQVVVSGLTPREVARPPEALACEALIRGGAAEALKILEASASKSARAGLIEAVAWDSLGDRARARRALTRAFRQDPMLGGMLPSLYSLHLNRMGGLLRDAMGKEWFPNFMRYYDALVWMHPDEERSIAPIVTWLQGLESAAGRTPAERLLLYKLLGARGGAERRAGRTEQARVDLLLARERLGALNAADLPGGAAVERLQYMARATRELVALDVAEGRLDDATGEVRRLLSEAPSRTVAGDILANMPELAPLRASPVWAEVEAARLLGRAVPAPQP